MQTRSSPRYNSLVDARAVGCSSINRATYAAIYGSEDDWSGARQVPRTR